MKKKFILNVDSVNKIVKVFAKGETSFCKIAEGIDIKDIPLNGVGFIDSVEDNEILVGYKQEDPFSAMLEYGGA